MPAVKSSTRISTIAGQTGGARRTAGNHRQDGARAEPGESKSNDAAQSGDYQALREELAHNAPLAAA